MCTDAASLLEAVKTEIRKGRKVTPEFHAAILAWLKAPRFPVGSVVGHNDITGTGKVVATHGEFAVVITDGYPRPYTFHQDELRNG